MLKLFFLVLSMSSLDVLFTYSFFISGLSDTNILSYLNIYTV